MCECLESLLQSLLLFNLRNQNMGPEFCCTLLISDSSCVKMCRKRKKAKKFSCSFAAKEEDEDAHLSSQEAAGAGAAAGAAPEWFKAEGL